MKKLNISPHDLSAGVVVFLVALPLCLGIALASNAPLMSGVISGIVGGLVVSLLSGSQLSVSGPAAGLAMIVAAQIASLGSFEVFLAAGLVAGILQVIFGALKLGGFADYVPYSVIRGMLVGIGIIIIYKQLPYALGINGAFESDVSFLESQSSTYTGFFDRLVSPLTQVSKLTILISIVSIGILFTWDKLKKSGHKFFEYFPGPLAVVVYGTVMNELALIFAPSYALWAHAGDLVNIPAYSSFSELYHSLPKPDLSQLLSWNVLQAGFIIAAIASIETLLSIEATDKIDPYKRISPTNRELLAQGAGNMIASLLGGLPMTAVIVRSSANVQAGGRTQASSFFHGILLLLAILLIPSLLNHIPLACLAAILIVTGCKLAAPSVFKMVIEAGKTQSIPFFATLITIIAFDLLSGVIFGTTVGMFFALRSNNHDVMTLVKDEHSYLLRFNKDISFVHKSMLKETLASVPTNAPLYIDGSRALFIDHDIREVIEDFSKASESRGMKVDTKHIFRKTVEKKEPTNEHTP